MSGLLKKIARLLKPSPEAGHLLIGGAYLVGAGVYFEIRQRDENGNDYVCELTGPISSEAGNEELGKHVLASLTTSTSLVRLVASARRTHWLNLLKQAGFSEKRFLERARLVMICGEMGRKISFQPTKRDGKNFIGSPHQEIRSCTWSAEVAGAELKSALLASS